MTRRARPARVRAAQPGEAAAIAAIHRELFDPPWERDGLRRLLELTAVRAFVAEAGPAQMLAGFILGRLAAEEAEILSIGVAPAWQRRGLGGQLAVELTASLVRSGVERLFLEVAADNAPALALYFRQGFRSVARRKGYYERRDEPAADALVLAKTL
jgi:[ribosomal protein S18]-alanine N-acetyltransferase